MCAQTISELKVLAEQGNVEAMHLLGRVYHLGNDEVEPNYVKAIQWYKKAVDLDYERSMHNLGLCYLHGTGVEPDAIMALNYFRQAANKDLILSIELLSQMYQDGVGVEQNFDSCFYWCEKAAKLGSSESQYKLSLLYSYGLGTEVDETAMFAWALKSAEAGNALGQELVGQLYIEGRGVFPDDSKALFWLTKAAEQGASASLGKQYQIGRIVELDKKKAFELFKVAAELGDSWGQYELAECYRYGKGTKQDRKLAMFWYYQSAQKGYSYAIEVLEEIDTKVDEDELRQKNLEYKEWFNKNR